MKEIISRDKKVKLCNINLDLSDNEINTIRKEFTFASKDLQRLNLNF